MEKTKPQLLARAIAIAAEAHQRQLDKAGSPYILHPLRKFSHISRVLLIAAARCTSQRFANNVLWLNGRAKQLRSHSRDAALSLLVRTSARESGRGAHALQLARSQPIPYTTHQQRDISSLTAAIGMQFVQDEKAQ